MRDSLFHIQDFLCKQDKWEIQIFVVISVQRDRFPLELAQAYLNRHIRVNRLEESKSGLLRRSNANTIIAQLRVRSVF